MNITNPSSFTIENLRDLIASASNEQDVALYVTEGGDVHLTSAVTRAQVPDILFRIETWDAGMGLVGPDAARDADWVRDGYYFLKKNWPQPQNVVMEVDRYPGLERAPLE